MRCKLFYGAIPYVSTAEFHSNRERAPHLEQPGHRDRLLIAARLAKDLVMEPGMIKPQSLSDLGCGDGGLLSLVQDAYTAWGYDFQPSNQAGWAERGVQAELIDVFNPGQQPRSPDVRLGDIVVMTEVLEHLADPDGILRYLRNRNESQGKPRFLVCSSPFTETDKHHAPEHAWAWDKGGYARMLFDAGWCVIKFETTGMFQVVSCRRRSSLDYLAGIMTFARYSQHDISSAYDDHSR